MRHRWLLWPILSVALVLGSCALIEEPVQPGEPIVDPITLETRDATMADAMASIEALDAKLVALSGNVLGMTTATNPLGPLGMAGTAGFGLLSGLIQRKRIQLQKDKQSLIEAMASAGTPLPEGLQA